MTGFVARSMHCASNTAPWNGSPSIPQSTGRIATVCKIKSKGSRHTSSVFVHNACATERAGTAYQT